MSWVVLVYRPGVAREVVIGPFREEVKADEWAERIQQGYPDFGATVEWAYSPAYREPLGETLDDLKEELETWLAVVL